MPSQEWLETIPAIAVYIVVGLIIGLESMGIPLPGEVTLISAALLAATHPEHISWIGVAIGASSGAILGDSLGYFIGRRYGRRLLTWAGRKYPKHFGPEHVEGAERLLTKWGMLAIFVGRFIALLRILAGPIAGMLHMHYPRFLIANAAGGIVWAGGTAFVIYKLGEVAEKWLGKFSWIGLIAAVLIGLITAAVFRRKAAKHKREEEPETVRTPE